jgi:hypothetical protein
MLLKKLLCFNHQLDQKLNNSVHLFVKKLLLDIAIKKGGIIF